jgi:hypothetical protein
MHKHVECDVQRKSIDEAYFSTAIWIFWHRLPCRFSSLSDFGLIFELGV